MVCLRISFLFKVLAYSSLDGYWVVSTFWLLWIMLLWTLVCKYNLISCFSSLVYIPKSEVARLSGNSVFNFLGNLHTVFHRDCSSFYIPIQLSSVAQSCLTLCNPMDCSTPAFPVHHQLPEFTQTHVHWVGDAIQLSHPLLTPSFPAFNLSQHQDLFQWVSSSHQVARVLEFQLQHQSFQ